MRCEACGSENPEAFAFCARCGADIRTTAGSASQVAAHAFGAGGSQVAAGAAVSTSSRSDTNGLPPMCPHCGANGCINEPICQLCGGDLSGGRTLPAPVGGIHWVQLRLEVQCVFCRTWSPVGHLGNGRFYCFSCARELPYLPGFWQKRLEHAAAGGDCFWSRFGHFPAWDRPKGMDDTELTELMGLLKVLGSNRQKFFAQGFSPHQIGEPISTKQSLTMAPGHPLCDSCHAPLTAQLSARGAVTMSCSGCGSHKSYKAPAAALSACQELIAVVAPDHLSDAKSAALKAMPQSAAVAITCPGCGGALHLAPGARVTTCSYCHTESIVPLGVMAQAFGSAPGEQAIWLAFRAPAKLRERYAYAARVEAVSGQEPSLDAVASGGPAALPRKPAVERRRTKPLLFALCIMIALVVVPGVIIFLISESGKLNDRRAPQVSASALQRFSFTMSSSEVAALLGAPAKARMEVAVDDPRIKEADITFGDEASISFDFTKKFDFKAALAQARKVCPNQLEQTSGRWYLRASGAFLCLSPSDNPSSISVSFRRHEEMTAPEKKARARQAEEALWAVARYAIFGKPAPSAAELRLANGPPLSEVKGFDLSVPVETAAKAFQARFPDGSCKTLSQSIECSVNVDHPLFSEFQLTWSISARARCKNAMFVLRHRDKNDDDGRVVSACLDAALGAGKDEVIAYSHGRTQRVWSLGGGDRGELGDYGFEIKSAAGHTPTEPPSWSHRSAALLDVLAACKR